MESIRKQKLLFLAEAVLVTLMWFTLPQMAHSENTSDLIWDILAVFLAWSCAMTAIGFAKQYLNKDSKFRKLATEAIYPFYLLHQPAIVVIGYLLVQWDIAVGLKVALITLSSFTITSTIYWLLIRPFNVLRVLFGMTKTRKEKTASISLWPLKPILANANRSTEINKHNETGLNHQNQKD